MNLLKSIFYTTCGCLFVYFYREGMQVAMNWTFLIWLPVVAWELANWLTPFKSTKKENQRS